MRRLYVILPCYNEAENIGTLIGAWLAREASLAPYALELLAIDDGSTDDTKGIIARAASANPQVHPIAHETNKGLGGGLLTGLSYFRANGQPGDLATVMDADNSHDPAYIHAMLEKISEGCDCVIASRYRRGSETYGVPPFRAFLSRGARLYYTLLLGVRGVRDYTCGYRVYTYDIINEAFDRYGEDWIRERGFACMMEALYKLYRVGARFAEVPFTLRYDLKRGESKMRVPRTAAASIKAALRLRFMTNTGETP
jgi:dolichol-phosphate mannosyltransferase